MLNEYFLHDDSIYDGLIFWLLVGHRIRSRKLKEELNYFQLNMKLKIVGKNK